METNEFREKNNSTTQVLATKVADPATNADNGTEKRMEELREKYKALDGKVYEVKTTVHPDDDTEENFDFIFRKPGRPSYDRYVKTSSTSGTRALETFVQDNICEEQLAELKEVMKEYPAMGINLGEKLLDMLGLSKETQVKKL